MRIKSLCWPVSFRSSDGKQQSLNVVYNGRLSLLDAIQSSFGEARETLRTASLSAKNTSARLPAFTGIVLWSIQQQCGEDKHKVISNYGCL